MNIPAELKYTRDHEWVKVEGNLVTVGITDFAQSSLGDVVFIEVPAKGTGVTVGKAFSVVESVKAVSDIYAPLAGVVVKVNDALGDAPEIVNQDPYGNGWIAVIEIAEGTDLSKLLDSHAYAKIVAEGGH
jgi:glycine cleavage system H protein